MLHMNREQCVGIPENITEMQAFRTVQYYGRLNRRAGRIFLDGPVDECDCLMDLMQLLGIKPEELLGESQCKKMVLSLTGWITPLMSDVQAMV